MAKYEEGTVVQLKSGGPKMTCTGKILEDGKVFCQWFAGSKLESGYFPPNSIIVIPEKAAEEKK